MVLSIAVNYGLMIMCQVRVYSIRAYCALPLLDSLNLFCSKKRVSFSKFSFNRLNIEECFKVLFYNIDHFLFEGSNKTFLKFIIEFLFDFNNDVMVRPSISILRPIMNQG